MSELRAPGQLELDHETCHGVPTPPFEQQQPVAQTPDRGALGLGGARARRPRRWSARRDERPERVPRLGPDRPARRDRRRDGVRKSNRCPPKILDFCRAPCARSSERAPGEARWRSRCASSGPPCSSTSTVRRSTLVTHAVRYDDGDVEEVLLAAERIEEWVYPGEGADALSVARHRRRSARSSSGAQSRRGDALAAIVINFAVVFSASPRTCSRTTSAWPSAGRTSTGPGEGSSRGSTAW